MLASTADYIFIWQLPLIGLFLAGWIAGGGLLLQWSLRRQKISERPRLGQCVLAVFLAGSAAAAGGGAIGLFVVTLGKIADISLVIPAAGGAVLAAAGVAYTVIYAMLRISFRATLRAATIPLLAVVLGGGILAGIAGPLSWNQRHNNLRRDRCRMQLQVLYQAITTYQTYFSDADPPSLQLLVQRNYITDKDLVAQTAPGRAVGFCYAPAPKNPQAQAVNCVLACDLPPNPGSSGRIVLRSNGDCYRMSESDFQDLLKRAENRAFAERLRAVQ